MNLDATSTILLRDYDRAVAAADLLPRDDLSPVLFGIFGEVGSVLTVAKKPYRESSAYTEYQASIEEEFGDVLWYIAALCRRLKDISLDELFRHIFDVNAATSDIAATDFLKGPLAQVATGQASLQLQAALLQLGQRASELLSIHAADGTGANTEKLKRFAIAYVAALSAVGVRFAVVAQKNITKVRGRFLAPETTSLPNFDADFREDERLPDAFKISIVQRSNGRAYLKWNGVFLGDPLTDNIADPDGYRFHDVFHFAHAAILHWSPVMRALIKHKRKSDDHIDEAQDGGRAIVVEEGLTAWIFSHAKQQNYFAGQDKLSFDLLKGVHQFVRGYEVAECPLKLWETAILEGYRVFLQVKNNNGGTVIGDRRSRSIKYEPPRDSGT
jgi:NTP pyrophosphatase (non-canonical NTP hydrolase)